MEPEDALRQAKGCDQGASVRIDGDAGCLGWTERDLFGRAVRETLTPDLLRPIDGHTHVHPRAVGRPGGRHARPARSYVMPAGTAVQRDEPARKPVRLLIHLHDERPLPIR